VENSFSGGSKRIKMNCHTTSSISVSEVRNEAISYFSWLGECGNSVWFTGSLTLSHSHLYISTYFSLHTHKERNKIETMRI
jgi:hypothetical protein